MIDILLKPIRSLLGLNFLKPKSEIKNDSGECMPVAGLEGRIFSVEDVYTPLSVAKEEIWRRWNDKELRKKVEDFLGTELPSIFNNEPKAVLLRYIASPNFESRFFMDLSRHIELDPIYGEFLEDKFCTWNQDKIHLAKMTFFHGIDAKGNVNITKKKLIDIEKNDGKLLCDVETIWGDKLIDFHHKLFALNYPDVEKFDAYCFRASSKNVIEYYEKLFAFFLCHGVLFENFINKDNHNESRFTRDVVLPAYANIIKRFGIRPLISPIYSIDSEENNDWMWYSGGLEKEISNLN